MAKILYIEDDEAISEVVLAGLAFFLPESTIVPVSTYSHAIGTLQQEIPFDLIISDFHYSGAKDEGRYNKWGSGGLDLLRYVSENQISSLFVFLTSCRPGEIGSKISADLRLPDHIFSKMDDSLIESIATYVNSAASPKLPSETYSKASVEHCDHI